MSKILKACLLSGWPFNIERYRKELKDVKYSAGKGVTYFCLVLKESNTAYAVTHQSTLSSLFLIVFLLLNYRLHQPCLDVLL